MIEKNRKDYYIALTISLALGFTSYYSFFSDIFKPSISDFFIFIYLVFFAIAYLAAIFFTSKDIKFDVIVIYLFFLLAYLTLYILYPQNIMFANQKIYILLLLSIPLYAMVRSISDAEIVYIFLLKFFYLMFGFNVLYFILYVRHIELYSMGFSYKVVLCILFFINELYVRKHNIIFNSVLTMLGILLIISKGSRGAIACLIAIFFIYQIFLSASKLKKGLLLGTIIAFCYIIYNNGLEIVAFINSKISDLGIYSRVLTKALNGNFFDPNGRNLLYFGTINKIKERPFLGWGIYGDRTFIPLMKSDNVYVHNIWLEIFVDFGLVLGGLIVSYILINMFISLLNKESSFWQLCVIFISYAFVAKNFSGSYLSTFDVWIAMGVIINCSENTPIRKGILR